MKITKIEAIPCTLPRKEGSPDSNVVLVKMHTDEGIIGAADGGTCNQDQVMLAIKQWEPILIGADPFDIQIIMSKIYRFLTSTGAAVGIIDFCLYDIVGKALKLPVYKLLGGKAAEKLGVAMMITRGGPKEKAAQAERVVAAGVKTLMCKVGPNWGNVSIEDDYNNVKAIRQAVGDKIRVGIDANGGLDYTSALDLCLKLEELNVFKVEQPVPRWDVDGMARLHYKLRSHVSAHESAIEINGLLDCIKKDACDSVCIKVVWSGGIMKSKEWLGIAKAANLAISCGAMVGSGFEAAAQAHFLASDAWCAKLDHANLGPVLLHNTFDTTIGITDDLSLNPPVFKDGYFYAPDGPGLGLELNEKIIPKLMSKGKAALTIGK
jgi:L-alanine-DL-glutamate epimerase-like enolase superfamily enzyme